MFIVEVIFLFVIIGLGKLCFEGRGEGIMSIVY